MSFARSALFTLAITLSASAIAAEPKNAYVQQNLVANKAKYKADAVDEKLINAWGIAIRPAGKGGHFWVTGKDISFEYVGDVRASTDATLQKLHTDNLAYVRLPVGGEEQFATSVVFSDSKEHFTITQGDITAPAKFIFASDGGVISAWTERKKEDGTFDRPEDALEVVNLSAEGAQFFGLAISQKYDRLYAADFGKAPQVRVFDGAFKPVAATFENPFDTNKNGKVDAGEFAPFNIQGLTTPAGDYRLFVAYAMTQACPKAEIKNGACKAGEVFAGEEDAAKPGLGRVAEFDADGKLIAVWEDAGKLSAPWGLVFAPEHFGALSGKLLVGNFGSGKIAAFDPATRKFTTYLQNKKGKPVVIDKLWGLLFGNGESLGDKNALYFAAGPDDEKDGIFGSLRPLQ